MGRGFVWRLGALIEAPGCELKPPVGTHIRDVPQEHAFCVLVGGIELRGKSQSNPRGAKFGFRSLRVSGFWVLRIRGMPVRELERERIRGYRVGMEVIGSLGFH